MANGINRFQANLRDHFFVLFEQFRFAEWVGRAPFEAWGEPEARAMLEESYRFAREELGPLNSIGDREGCRLEEGTVRTPSGFANAWKRIYETGIKQVVVDPEHGGQGAPKMLYVLIDELLNGANVAFNMYPGLTCGAADLIAECGAPEQIARYAEKMFHGHWAGTMCLTEAHAGSDVGSATCSARKNADGSYSLRGTKIYISGGEHDLTENIVHLVLARTLGAPPGTRGLSLFIVPKRRIGADGASGESNDVQVASIEHKMGINGSATCVLNFGEANGCVGELLGGVENQGMAQMFKMMNGARISVGIQGLSVASSAYLNALEYAKDRKQGAHYANAKDASAPRVAIVEHPDIRRMLLDAKAHVEGIRALVVKLAYHQDRARQSALDAVAPLTSQASQALTDMDYHLGQVELLTPLLKAYGTDQAFRICGEMIQVFGGAGYLKDHPVEQYCRDAKIFAIYEGTNHIQALDLVGRKLGLAGGQYLKSFLGDVGGFVKAQRAHPSLGAEVLSLGVAAEAIAGTVKQLLAWSQGPELPQVLLNANRFLEMLSQLAVGWLLLDGAVLAGAAVERMKASGSSEDHPDFAFYSGKLHVARYYARNVVPRIAQAAQLMIRGDGSALEILEASF